MFSGGTINFKFNPRPFYVTQIFQKLILKYLFMLIADILAT